jgi:tetratricopeptide (TPR) repeat protein
MTLSIRICCFVGLLIMIFAAAAPAFAQIEAHGSLSGCDQKKALPDYWNEIESAPHNSLANYCMAELLLQERNYQASVNAYRDALRGDGYPTWTKVWSQIQMGKIFDITRQRERALAQYQLALQSGDNTDGAMNQARELLEHPFEWPEGH